MAEVPRAWDISAEVLKQQRAKDMGNQRNQSNREFSSGANRDSEAGKLDYEGFLSPLAFARYAQYMHGHRTLKDGTLRASDNWQKGIPRSAYMKSLWRHLIKVWEWHRKDLGGCADACLVSEETLEDALCGVIFNAMGYLHEVEKEKRDE